MKKKVLLTVATITLLLLAVVALGAGRTHIASAHAQTPVVHTQVLSQKADPAQGTPETSSAESATETSGEAPGESQDQNLPGGGHQDPAQGNPDHQFDGTE